MGEHAFVPMINTQVSKISQETAVLDAVSHAGRRYHTKSSNITSRRPSVTGLNCGLLRYLRSRKGSREGGGGSREGRMEGGKGGGSVGVMQEHDIVRMVDTQVRK